MISSTLSKSVYKKTGKRILGLTLAAALCLGSLGACGQENSNTRVVFTTGFGKDEVFQIEDVSCKKAEIMVYLSTIQNQYESVYGEEIWNTTLDGVTLEENVKDIVLARIARIKTMYLLAREKGISLDERETEKVETAAAEYFDSLSEAEVELLGITQEQVASMYREYAMADKVYRQIIQDINPEISDDEARTIKVQYIFFNTTYKDREGNYISYSTAERETVRLEAQEVRELAAEGSREFTELAAQYSDDTNITCSFGKGEMDTAFEDAAFLLETDEISQVVETPAGYYIIKCLSTFDRAQTDANKLEIVEQRKKEVFGQEYDAFVNTLVRNLNEELWQNVSLIHDERLTTDNFFEVFDKYFSPS